MSGAEIAGTGGYRLLRHAAEHPDTRLAERLTAGLQWWLGRAYEAAPTSALTGAGAVAACEREFSRLHGGRPALLLPSATYALRAALDTLGIGAGDEVIVPALDWPATYQAVLSVSATPVPVAVDPRTLTLSPAAAGHARTERTRAVVACHLHGVAADIPGLCGALPDVPIIEDCAGALGSTLDGRPVGTFGDFAVLSLGPGKTVDAGEGGVLLAADAGRWRAAVARTTHPLRQNLTGLDPALSLGALSIRPHPATAILALYELSRWNRDAAALLHRSAAEALSGRSRGAGGGRLLLGLDERRENAQPMVPVLLDEVVGPTCFGSVTGAVNLADAGTALHAETESQRRAVALLPVAAVDGPAATPGSAGPPRVHAVGSSAFG